MWFCLKMKFTVYPPKTMACVFFSDKPRWFLESLRASYTIV